MFFFVKDKTDIPVTIINLSSLTKRHSFFISFYLHWERINKALRLERITHNFIYLC